jgi:hypothetical protein
MPERDRRGRFSQRNQGIFTNLLRQSTEALSTLLNRNTEEGNESPEEPHEEMASPTPLLPKAPTYDGTTGVEAFIWSYQEYSELLQRDETMSLRMLTFSLQGRAREIYHQQWGAERPPSLTEAYESLRVALGEPKHPEGDYSGLLAIKQKPEEPVTTYVERFNKERARISGPTPDALLLAAFTNGLQIDIETKVQEKHPLSYQHAVADARAAEQVLNHIKERKNEERALRGKDKEKEAQTTTITRTPWRHMLPAQSMGGVRPNLRWPQQQQRNPLLPPRTYLQSGTPAKQPMTTPAEAREDPVLESLRKQMASLTIGSMQFEQLRNLARQQGRCLRCFSRQHMARACPHNSLPTNSVRLATGSSDVDYEEEMEKAEEFQQFLEENPDYAELYENGQWDPKSAQ